MKVKIATILLLIIFAILILFLSTLLSYSIFAPLEANDFITIDSNSELVRSLNLLYDPNFYSTEKTYYISFDFPDANSPADAAKELRKWCKWWPENFSDKIPTKIYADIHVKIGNEEHTASFEDLFEWMGFKDEVVYEPNIVIWDLNDVNSYFAVDPNASEWWIPTLFDQITILLDQGNIADPFTLTIDGVDRQFTHEEFKRRLGFIEPNSPNEIIWLGSPGVANWDGFHLNNGFLIDYEIGFRSDGIVVWKESVKE